jgi:hypothetical protein
MKEGPGGQIERPRQRVLLVFAWSHDFLLCPLPHPGCADLGQHMDIEFIGKHHAFMRLHLFRLEAHAGQTLDPLGVVIYVTGPLWGPSSNHPLYGWYMIWSRRIAAIAGSGRSA